MTGDYSTEIKGHVIEYFDSDHVYVVNGIITPSITQILKRKYKNEYKGISQDVLKRASEMGTAVHDAIEKYCRGLPYEDFEEVQNFDFLLHLNHRVCIGNEIPVLLFRSDEVVSVGRFDCLLIGDSAYGIADIKRTSTLHKDYLSDQLNLYRRAYIQSYGGAIDFLAGLHLREHIRRYVDIPIMSEEELENLIDELLGGNDE